MLQIGRACRRSRSTTRWWRSWSLTRTLASTMPWQFLWLWRLTKGDRFCFETDKDLDLNLSGGPSRCWQSQRWTATVRSLMPWGISWGEDRWTGVHWAAIRNMWSLFNSWLNFPTTEPWTWQAAQTSLCTGELKDFEPTIVIILFSKGCKRGTSRSLRPPGALPRVGRVQWCRLPRLTRHKQGER